MKKSFSMWRAGLAAASALMGLVAGAWAEPFVVGWGMNANGQAFPTPVEALSGATAIAAGYHHSLAVVDSCTYAWGRNDEGQCDVPSAGRTNVAAVAAGEQFSVARRTDGTLVSWGQFGPNNPVSGRLTGDYTNDVAQVAAGQAHVLVLKNDGRVLAAGVNSYAPECTVPTNDLSDVVQVAAGAYFSFALQRDGTIVTWGSAGEDIGGVLEVPATLQGHARKIAAGHYHALAITDSGDIVQWGSVVDHGIPDGARTGATDIAGGYDFSLARTSDGKVYIWGNGLDVAQLSPMPASLAAGVSQVAAGYGHALALGAGLAPYWLEDAIPAEAYVARAYAATVTATGMPAVTYHKSGNNWPSWLKLDARTGALSGTPTQTAKRAEFAVVASNVYGAVASATLAIEVSDTPLDPPAFITTTVPDGEVGLPYRVAIVASNAAGYYLSRADQYALPAGLALAEDGTLSGTPAAEDATVFYVMASNATDMVEQQFSIRITSASAAPEILTGSPLPAARLDEPYSVQFETDRVATFAQTGGTLPAGLDLEPSTGILSGAPTAPGAYTFTIQAANAVGTTTAEFALDVNAWPAIETETLPAGRIGAAYSGTLAATGWPVPVFALASGSLPGGLSLGADGVISGTPTAAGTFSFAVTASNLLGYATRDYSIAVDAVQAPQFTAMTFIASNKTLKLEWTTPVTTNTYLYWSTNISAATPAWKSLGRQKSGVAIAQTNSTPIYYRLRIP